MKTGLDINILQKAMGDDPAIVCEVILDFIAHAESGIAQIRNAVAKKDEKQLGTTAHMLKGSASLVGAYGLSETLARVESAAEATDWSLARHLVPHLDGLMQRIRESAVTLVDAQPTIWK